jgi:hypothetical protein
LHRKFCKGKERGRKREKEGERGERGRKRKKEEERGRKRKSMLSFQLMCGLVNKSFALKIE